MRFIGFEIKNYKGIKHCILDLKFGSPRIVSLVGLNESGKTTILEAISHFVAGDKDLQRIYGIETTKVDKARFIPKSKKMDFSDDIEIIAKFTLDNGDLEAVREATKEQGYRISFNGIGREMHITQYFKFKHSSYVSSGRNIGIRMQAYEQATQQNSTINAKHPLWKTYYETLYNRMPDICYFPTFIFEIPDRIYIEEHGDEDALNAYYRKLMGDIFASLGQDVSLKTHVIDRIRKGSYPIDWATFLQSESKEQVDHTMMTASLRISEIVIRMWKEVFKLDIDEKRIELNYEYDSITDLIAIRISVVDFPERYRISERSLGFQWFFCFWLFTYFRSRRADDAGVVFLFDEPASNLHASAQNQILKNLERLTENDNIVLYSTHSHHMIDPRWLDRSLIVSNGLDHDGSLSDELKIKPEFDVTAVPYRRFVGSHSKQIAYYLPILEALDYQLSDVTLGKHSLIVEGKADFAFFSLALKADDLPYRIVPAGGATTMAPIASILIGWGASCLLLLDDDKEGVSAAKGYAKTNIVAADCIGTIAQFDATYSGQSLEKVLLNLIEDKVKKYYSAASADKAMLQRFLIENHASGNVVDFPSEVVQFAKKVDEWVRRSLD